MSFFSKILDKLGLSKDKPTAAATAAPVKPAVSAPAVDPLKMTYTPAKPAAPAGTATPPAVKQSAVQSAPAPVAPTPMSEVDVVKKLEQLAKGTGLDWKVSIVDLLKLLDMDSSYESRVELAKELGCPPELMHDSAKMNVWLHQAVLHRPEHVAHVVEDVIRQLAQDPVHDEAIPEIRQLGHIGKMARLRDQRLLHMAGEAYHEGSLPASLLRRIVRLAERIGDLNQRIGGGSGHELHPQAVRRRRHRDQVNMIRHHIKSRRDDGKRTSNPPSGGRGGSPASSCDAPAPKRRTAVWPERSVNASRFAAAEPPDASALGAAASFGAAAADGSTTSQPS